MISVPTVARGRGSRTLPATSRRWDEITPDLAALSEQALGAFDVAVLNLALARGLVGAEDLDADACIDKLDSWAELVRVNTERWWPSFLRSPARYDHSPAQFRMTALVTVLQRQLGVRYNLAFSEGDYDASDSRNLFVHGVLFGHGGICVTMPVLYIAIGRRLGYPLKLVNAKEHLFARWDDLGGERLNIECTSTGFVTHDDLYYHKRPRPLTEREVASGLFLQNLTPRQELAVFLKERGVCQMDNLRTAEAMEAFCNADRCWPQQPGGACLWAAVAVLHRVIEEAREKARRDARSHIDLRSVAFPKPKEDWDRWAVPCAQAHLERILRVRARKAAIVRHRAIEQFCAGADIPE